MTATDDPHVTDIQETPLLGGRVICVQPAKGYRSAIDAVLMAAAVPAGEGAHVLDLGTGAGSAALCLAARVPGVRVTGLDVQAPLIDLARRGAALSGFDDRVKFVTGDVLDPPSDASGVLFDHVMLNPPYLPPDRARPPQDPVKAVATIEGAARLHDWIAAAMRLSAPKASITVVHRADRLDDLLAALSATVSRPAGRQLGGITVLPLYPDATGKAAKRVLVQAWKGAARPLTLLPGLVLHAAGGEYTPEVEHVLREGASLALEV